MTHTPDTTGNPKIAVHPTWQFGMLVSSGVRQWAEKTKAYVVLDAIGKVQRPVVESVRRYGAEWTALQIWTMCQQKDGDLLLESRAQENGRVIARLLLRDANIDCNSFVTLIVVLTHIHDVPYRIVFLAQEYHRSDV